MFREIRVGRSFGQSLLNRVSYKLIESVEEIPFPGEEIFPEDIETHLPLQQRVVDKLADMLFASDMILDMLHDDRHFPPAHVAEVEPSIRRLYDEVNELMKKLTD
jgi:hypothetical protein